MVEVVKNQDKRGSVQCMFGHAGSATGATVFSLSYNFIPLSNICIF